MHRRSLAVAAVAAFSLAAPALAAPVDEFWVDPHAGLDVNPGTQAKPLKRLSQAVALNPVGTPLIVHLAPGTYSPTANQESYPLLLPPSAELLGDPCGTRLEWDLDPLNPTPQTILKLDGALFTSPAPHLLLRDLVIDTPHRGLQVFVKGALDAPLIELERVQATAYYPLVVQVHAQKSAAVLVRDCALQGLVSCLKVTTFQGAQATVRGERSRFGPAGLGPAIDLLPTNAGSNVDLTLLASVIAEAPAGVRTVLAGGGTAQTFLSGCAFYRNRLFTIPPSSYGAIVDENPQHATWPKHVIASSVFFENMSDLPQYEASRYTLSANLVEQPGLPGTTVGQPLWADPDAGDFHQLPGSPTIDAGDPVLAPAVDLDGDPVLDGKPDAGPDERYERYLYYAPASPKLGKTSQTRVHGVPGAAFGVAFALAQGGAFGAFQLVGPSPHALFTGVVPTGGVFEGTLFIPSYPTLVGVTVFHQALYLEPGGQVGWSANAVENLLCK